MKNKDLIQTTSKNTHNTVLDPLYQDELKDFIIHGIRGGIICCEISQGFPIVFVNDYFLALLKYDCTEDLICAASGVFTNLIYGLDPVEKLQDIALLPSDKNLHLTHRMITKDSDLVWVNSSGKHYTLKDGKEVIFFLCIDITDLISLQDQLVSKQNKLSLANKEYRAKLKTEPLTKLLNREFFEYYMKKHLKMNCDHYAAIMIDLDDFKITNDTFGHLCGDAVLVEVARRIKETFRKTDFISRYGGDEFMIFLTNVESLENCERKVHKLYEKFKSPFYYNDIAFTIKVSIGVVYNRTKTAYTFHEIYQKTDDAMYKSKYAGKDQYYIDVI